MPAKWQQWMPLKIDKWRGSPAVRAMHPAARSGYLDLLLSQWQSDDCSLPSDVVDLAELSCLGDELWAVYGARILRNFDALENGRLRNSVCFEEWGEAKSISDHNHEVRSNAGKKGNKSRWGNRNCDTNATESIAKPIANGSQNIATLTETLTVTKRQRHTANGKPSPDVQEIYQAYPRHVAPDAAHRAIAKALTVCPRETILAAIERFKRDLSAKGTETEFIPYPATWFNGGRYRDEAPAALFGGNGRHPPPSPASEEYDRKVKAMMAERTVRA